MRYYSLKYQVVKEDIDPVVKVKTLETLVKKIFGDPEATIDYSRWYGSGCAEIRISNCDLDDCFGVINRLRFNDCNIVFYNEVKKVDFSKIPKEVRFLYREPYEGQVSLQISFEPLYWKENERLQDEVKKLKQKLREKSKADKKNVKVSQSVTE